MEINFHISGLIQKQLNGELSAEEQGELDAWIAASAANKETFEKLHDMAWIGRGLQKMAAYNTTASLERIYDAKVTPLFNWKRWMAAASVLLIIAVASFFILYKKENKPAIAKTVSYKNDVVPGVDGAILHLGNGETIVLDSAADGSLVMQSNTQVRKVGAQLVYQPENSAAIEAKAVYNTLETPRGKKYKLVLPDGTQVWLDAASSITFPSMFIGDYRKVVITGQAYFEVRSDKDHPFFVNANNKGLVEVMGTHFNVNAYEDEDAVRTTLLEGHVNFSRTELSIPMGGIKLEPGQQAVLKGKQLSVLPAVNTDEVIAWKENKFYFKSTDIKSLMRQLARWYDIEVQYETIPTEGFNAKIDRNTNLSTILKALELTGEIKFAIDGKKITVSK